MKYRKKPVNIEAILFNRHSVIECVNFTNGILKNINVPRSLEGVMTGEIKTLEGVMTVSENDYIIKGVQREFYPCKPDIFKMTYEKVDDEDEESN